MAEIIHCPSCRRKLQVPEPLLGQDVQCPTCNATFVASLDEGPASPPPVPRERPGGRSGPQPPRRDKPATSAGDFDVGRQDFGVDDADDDDAPRRRRGRGGRAAYAPEDDDDDYDDYDDDRPRRRRRDWEPHRGPTIMTLGILSLVLGCVGLILGPIAWVMGNQDMTEIQSGRMDPEGEGMTNAGRVCGIVATCLNALGLFACCAYWVLISAVVAGARRGPW